MQSIRGLLKFALFLAFIAFALAAEQRSVAAEMTQCDSVCNPSADCETWCMSDLWETTCGEYGQGPLEGWCEGGYCGDSVCAPSLGENKQSCYDDCGWCGDGICNPTPEAGGTSYCAADCGGTTPPPDGTGSCSPDLQDCGGTDVCHPSGTCIETPPNCGLGGCCETNAECATEIGESCYAYPGGLKACHQ